MAAYWHFDHTTNVAAGKKDFYLVAVHEWLHAMGIDTASSWDNLVSGTTWSGPVVIGLNGGSGVGLIHTDGILQEIVMDPNITMGTRQENTLRNLGFLKNIGVQTVTIPVSSALVVFLLDVSGIDARGTADANNACEITYIRQWPAAHYGTEPGCLFP